jgi:hypothetical protein
MGSEQPVHSLFVNHCHENAAVPHRRRRNRAETLPVSATMMRHLSSNPFAGFVMRTPVQNPGFSPRAGRKLGRERRTATFAELVATVGLMLSTIIAATVVTAGIARADVATNILDNETGLFALSLIIGGLFAAMGGLTVLTLPGHHKPRKQH